MVGTFIIVEMADQAESLDGLERVRADRIDGRTGCQKGSVQAEILSWVNGAEAGALPVFVRETVLAHLCAAS